MSSKMLLLITLVTMAAAFKVNQNVEELIKEEQVDPEWPMMDLGHTVFYDLAKYECARGGDKCSTYNTIKALLEIERFNVDCEHGGRLADQCDVAKEGVKALLGIDREVIRVADVAELYVPVMKLINKDLPFVTGIFGGVEKFVCHKEGEDTPNCAAFKAVHQVYETINTEAEEEDEIN